MKKLHTTVLSLLCLLFSHFIQAQTNITNDYVVISTAGVSDTAPYTAALDAANWEGFRLQNERYQLSFENGFTIELKSAVELLNLGYPLNIANYQPGLPVGYTPPTLTLLSGNVIGMAVHSTPSKTAQ
jgi:hypothetical protein